MASSLRFGAALAAGLALLALAGCARPTGDFGRASDSVLHDEVMPRLGKMRAQGAGEPVSEFNLADVEIEMRDRVWRYLTAPHAKDWYFDIAVELQRTRLAPMGKFNFKVDLYYRWLTGEAYASSRTRYNRLTDDIEADIATMKATFAAICAVQGLDRQREVAAGGIDGLEPAMRQEALDRRAENRMVIGWFTRSVGYRYDAYSYALDHLLVETPHEEAIEADAGLSELAVWVDAAERDDFCRTEHRGTRTEEAGIKSRFLMTGPDEGPYRK
ncbi:MAG TPA: hypothetical protein VG757_13440 [Devosia sp.]|nr:hypothetical protein [Devosia sp.]